LIADFDRHHPGFLPPAFSEFRVEEPDPGRVLTESDARSSMMMMTCVVTPDGPSCRVQVEAC
jgi:hypothetical protein